MALSLIHIEEPDIRNINRKFKKLCEPCFMSIGLNKKVTDSNRSRSIDGRFPISIEDEDITSIILTPDKHLKANTEFTLDFEIPKGFQYDGASIPRIAWTPLGLTPDGVMLANALPHDFFYGRGKHGVDCRLSKQSTGQTYEVTWNFTRQVADFILKKMVAFSVDTYRANIIYYTVRAFAWAHFYRGAKPPSLDEF